MAATVVMVAAAITGSAWWLLGVATTGDGRVNAVRGALTAGAAAGGGMGLLLAFRRQQFHETDATEQRITGRYTAAIDQLGSDRLDVRIGGIYALERIARDSRDDHPTVMDVLATFVREHTRPGRNNDHRAGTVPARWTATPASADVGDPVPAADIQAALTVLARRIIGHDSRRIALTGAHLNGADLSSVNLDGADLSGVSMNGANLRGARLNGVNLRGAHLRAAHLEGANLEGANLNGTDLRGANVRGANVQHAYLRSAYLSGAYLSSAHLNGANLSDAHLNGADLSNACLNDTYLNGADLSNAYFNDAFLRSANLSDANLNGADMSGADMSGADLRSTNLARVVYNGTTRWPEGFTPPSPDGGGEAEEGQ
ncbi:MAG TPA: pentapeptide repeat-containing protein [Streptosporangiaceae bacterium]|jgi:uncharacterized protein YjbI with pentapeptide repeats